MMNLHRPLNVLVFLLLIATTGCQQLLDEVGNQKGLAELKDLVLNQYGEHHNVPPLPADLAEKFAYTSNATATELRLKNETANYYHFKGVLSAQDAPHIRNFPSFLSTSEGHYYIRFEFFVSKRVPLGVPGPLVIQIPPLGSGGTVEADIADYYTSRATGAHCLVVYPDHAAASIDQPIDQTNQYFIRNTVAIQQALDFVLAVSNLNVVPVRIDPSSIFSMGISLGGLMNAYLIAVEPRIKKGVIIMGGGQIASIISHSREPSVTEYREFWREKLFQLGLTWMPNDTSFEGYLHSIMKIDPITLAPYVLSKRGSMIISKDDSVVPTQHQYGLWFAYGRPAMSLVDYKLYDQLGISHNEYGVPFELPTGGLPTGHFDIVFAKKQVLDYTWNQFIYAKLTP